MKVVITIGCLKMEPMKKRVIKNHGTNYDQFQQDVVKHGLRKAWKI